MHAPEMAESTVHTPESVRRRSPVPPEPMEKIPHGWFSGQRVKAILLPSGDRSEIDPAPV